MFEVIGKKKLVNHLSVGQSCTYEFMVSPIITFISGLVWGLYMDSSLKMIQPEKYQKHIYNLLCAVQTEIYKGKSYING